MQPLTLRNYYEEIHKPVYLIGRRISADTIKNYDLTMRLWAELIGDPPLSELAKRPEGPVLVGKWMAELSKRAGKRTGSILSAATINSHRRDLYSIMNRAESLGYLDRVPTSDPMPEFRRAPRSVEEDILSAIYRSCSVAKHPHYQPDPGAWWRALIVLGYNTALRRRSILSIPVEALVLEKRPFLVVDCRIIKTRRELLVPLHRIVVEHLKKIHFRNDKVFDWPHSQRTFYREWHKIQSAAGVKKHIGLHDLRRTCASEVCEHASPQAAQAMLGHASFNTTGTRYINWLKILSAAVDKIPQPEAFLSA